MGLENLESRQLLSLTTQLVQVPMPQSAINADPTLANYKIFDLQVTLDPGERWISVDMQAELSQGSFYNVSDANHGQTYTQPNLWPLFPAIQADTAVAASSFQKPIILGEYNPTIANGGVFKSQETNVSWGSLNDTGTGTFTVARLTVSNDAVGTIVGQDASTFTPAFKPKAYSFLIKNGVSSSLSSISGTVFNDQNGNGKTDGDPGLAGVTVYLDKNNNGVFDTGEKSTVSGGDGTYIFNSLTPGTYFVREVVPKGYRKTFPSGSSYKSVLSSGVNGIHKDFADTTTALLSGTVFNDKNSNGKKDSGEGGLAGFTIWLDLNKNGKLDKGEISCVSDTNGYWVFKGVTAGTYLVRIAAKTGYKAINHTFFTQTLASGQTVTGKLFAEHKVA
jgi:hypothetical protein